MAAKPFFRPDPARGVYVQGTIDHSMVNRLTPRILLLQSRERSPITVYIDSDGGNIADTESILRLLKSPSQDALAPCVLITVVTGRAASAAADLLSSGDYSLAYPNSSLWYHGLRMPSEAFPRTVTVEVTSMLRDYLRVSNDIYAKNLAGKILRRFMFRYLTLRPEFDAERQKLGVPSKSDVECFLSLVESKLSLKAKDLFKKARERYVRYESLLAAAVKTAKKRSAKKRTAQIEAERIKAIVSFEVDSNKGNKDWSFQAGGLNRLNDDFFLLNEYLEISKDETIRNVCAEWWQFALSPTEYAEIESAPEANRDALRIDKVRPIMQPLWSFFMSMCHALQEGENELTATDGIWLGLIDEIIGDTTMPCLRVMVESIPDAAPSTNPPALEPKGEDEKQGQKKAEA